MRVRVGIFMLLFGRLIDGVGVYCELVWCFLSLWNGCEIRNLIVVRLVFGEMVNVEKNCFML